ncbi:ribokinase [Shewanella sp. OPT22]|nr:ribokinase [Shewanella sp. OPT22]
MKNITVLGSSNIDYISEVKKFPKPGETILSTTYRTENGGKGANQAIACSRLGGKTTFISCVGDDKVGSGMLEDWKKDNLSVSSVEIIEDSVTGAAQITIDQKGENNIIISAGANQFLTSDVVEKHQKDIESSDFLLLQLETPTSSNVLAAKVAKQSNSTIILNPAPAKKVPQELLELVQIITPNESEASALTGIKVVDQKSAAQAAEKLHQSGVETVIITLGSQGVLVSNGKEQPKLIPAYTVTPVDTVAAGDTFNGALLIGLSEGKDIYQASDFANVAAALAVSQKGAQRSVPYRNQVEDFLKNNV